VTLLLDRSTVERNLDIGEAMEALEHGFRAPHDVRPLRVRTDLPGHGTATCLLPGLLPGVPAYTVKINAKFPDATPALRGVVCLHDMASGELLAVADSASITAWRTGLAAALGTHVLADPAATTFGLVGAGAQARVVAIGMRHLRGWEPTVAADPMPGRAGALAPRVVAGAVEVAEMAEVIVLATWSRTPLLHAADVPVGRHLTSLGADEPGKIELSADLLTSGRVLVDDVDLSAAAGALGSAGLGPGAAAGTLTDVLTGELAARDGVDRTTIYAPVGLPWQDLAVLWAVYRRAVGTNAAEIDFLS
jgi:ornithine cyclodeaminase/alanine dehydrogenase-like protein (mu-crystallin family)